MCPQRPEESVTSLEMEESQEVVGCWEKNVGPLQEQRVLFTPELSPQSGLLFSLRLGLVVEPMLASNLQCWNYRCGTLGTSLFSKVQVRAVPQAQQHVLSSHLMWG